MPSPRASVSVTGRLTFFHIQSVYMQNCKQNWLSAIKKCWAFGWGVRPSDPWYIALFHQKHGSGTGRTEQIEYNKRINKQPDIQTNRDLTTVHIGKIRWIYIQTFLHQGFCAWTALGAPSQTPVISTDNFWIHPWLSCIPEMCYICMCV